MGAGLAGALLAWRLSARPEFRVTLLTGDGRPDATAASGGLVRAFEPGSETARLAALSLAELRADPRLRAWAGYRESPSLYILGGADAPVAALPPTARWYDAGRLAAEYGIHGLPDGAAAVWEPVAGHISPHGLRRAVCADLAARGTAVTPGRLHTVARTGEGGVRYGVGSITGETDALVLATGAWTGPLLNSLGLPADGPGLRTKVVQCAVYRTAGRRPPPFVDGTTGLYGRPVGDDRMLLGLPTRRWGAAAGAPHFLAREERAVRTTAARRLPGLSLERLVRPVAAVDAYGPSGQLALAPVADGSGRLFLFTGGGGGSAKLALAASHEAADTLSARLHAPVPHPTCTPREMS
ncbi:FAD-dependent oxidoreductase [Streptomyces morookaense]|uniref:NAD(P)/FAD-dependent oxidoreductase n=1 Tax=Streptomyces morookaense TaxID=1970 RepID=UPI0034113356